MVQPVELAAGVMVLGSIQGLVEVRVSTEARPLDGYWVEPQPAKRFAPSLEYVTLKVRGGKALEGLIAALERARGERVEGKEEKGHG